jgi:hypothetical protein
MDSRSQFILQLLQKLGAPLMRAVNARSGSADEGAKDAQTISALLSETVKISIALSQAMNLKPEDGDADAIRVTLAALAADLVADSYKETGRLPTEADSRRITKSLESVLAFTDNFAPAAQHAQRLQTIDGAAPFMDEMQVSLYAMNALVPAIAAIAEFPFGQQETKLIQEVATTLSDRAKTLRSNLVQIEGDGADGKMAELVLLQSLAQIYASAHRAETTRLKTLPEDSRGDLSLGPVWEQFDRQLAMLEVLLGTAGGVSSGRGGKGVKPAAEAPAEEPPAQPAAPAAQAPAAQEAAPPAKPANPMSFFKKS